MLQVAFLSAPKEIIPKNGAHILPVVVACDVRKPMKEDDKRLALPAKYKISREYFGKKVSATVNSPIFLKYKHNQADGVKFGPANEFTFEEINSAEHKTINWNPLHGQVGTAAEMDWILKGSWKRSRS